MQRRYFKRVLSFPGDLAQEAERLRAEAGKLGPGAERHDLERQRAILATCTRHPGDHYRRARVSTHGVNRDARAHVHAWCALVRDAAQASVETISRPL